MRRCLQSWLTRGGALLSFSLLLGCAPASEEPKPTIEPAAPATEDPAASTETPAATSDGLPAEVDATPEQDAAEERKDEAEAAGADPLDTTSDDPAVKLGEPEDPVNLK